MKEEKKELFEYDILEVLKKYGYKTTPSDKKCRRKI